ncbi:MAG: efflux RND transporter periplasmic adaptor subunit [Gammaproteobacteria bacterium]|nr:efflux RND transporter periplasmic adaptor subunit [Gammaproteobacteria bacterium]
MPDTTTDGDTPMPRIHQAMKKFIHHSIVPQLAAVVALLVAGAAHGHGELSAFGSEGGEGRRTIHVGLPQAMAGHPGLITTEQAIAQDRITTLRTDGRVAARPDREQEVTINTGGAVREVFIRRGQRVAEGEPMVRVFSPDFMLTQRGYLAMMEDEVRLEQIRTLGNLPDYLEDARENLLWWGMTEGEVEALVEDGTVKETLTATTPISGIVTAVLVEPGALINAGDRGMSTFVITGAPVARVVLDDGLWAEGRVAPERLHEITVGQKVRMRVGRTIRWYGGEVVLVDPMVDPDDGRGRFYVTLDHFPPAYGLGAPLEMLVETPEADGVWVPGEAVITVDGAHYVYVQKDVDIYERRYVDLGARDQGWVQVREGVAAGEAVVTGGSQLLEGKRLLGGGPGGPGGGDDHH